MIKTKTNSPTYYQRIDEGSNRERKTTRQEKGHEQREKIMMTSSLLLGGASDLQTTLVKPLMLLSERYPLCCHFTMHLSAYFTTPSFRMSIVLQPSATALLDSTTGGEASVEPWLAWKASRSSDGPCSQLLSGLAGAGIPPRIPPRTSLEVVVARCSFLLLPPRVTFFSSEQPLRRSRTWPA